jgi:CRAL/TRIO domain
MSNILLVSDAEVGPLEQLRERARAVTTEEQYLGTDDLIRVLRARDLKVDPAFEMWTKWYDWRMTYRAQEITRHEVKPHLITGKAFYRGEDNYGRPCLILRFRYHHPDQFTTEETMRFVIYLVEKGIKKADKKGVGQICVLNDRSNITSANRDNKLITLIRSLASMLQDFYAERLGAVYILHVNWLYWLLFQAAKPLINKKTREKIHIIRNIEGLKEHFPTNKLMVEYGGEDDYVYRYPKQETPVA